MKTTRKPKGGLRYSTAGGVAVYSVREAKAHFSALVGRAAQGEEITITWHGQAHARLAPVRMEAAALHVDRTWLQSMPFLNRGTRAEKIVRTDRDARG